MPTDLKNLYSDPLFRQRLYQLVKSQPVELPDGRKCIATIWKIAHVDRSTRRIQCHDALTAIELFDSDDCHDFGNAYFKYEEWAITQQPKEDELKPLAFTCDHCGAEVRDGDEACVTSDGEQFCANCGRKGQREAQRVANPHYTPTVEEALRNPAQFVDGMHEIDLGGEAG